MSCNIATDTVCHTIQCTPFLLCAGRFVCGHRLYQHCEFPKGVFEVCHLLKSAHGLSQKTWAWYTACTAAWITLGTVLSNMIKV